MSFLIVGLHILVDLGQILHLFEGSVSNAKIPTKAVKQAPYAYYASS